MSDEDNLPDFDPLDPELQLSFCKRLKWRYREETASLGDEVVLKIVQDALAVCPTLNILKEQDIHRFIALSVLITPEQKQSKLIEGVVRRMLANVDWSSTKRLDFIYRHIVGRPVSPHEIDYGEPFVPAIPRD